MKKKLLLNLLLLLLSVFSFISCSISSTIKEGVPYPIVPNSSVIVAHLNTKEIYKKVNDLDQLIRMFSLDNKKVEENFNFLDMEHGIYMFVEGSIDFKMGYFGFSAILKDEKVFQTAIKSYLKTSKDNLKIKRRKGYHFIIAKDNRNNNLIIAWNKLNILAIGSNKNESPINLKKKAEKLLHEKQKIYQEDKTLQNEIEKGKDFHFWINVQISC